MSAGGGILGETEASKEKIGKQIVLPWTKAFEISFKSVRVRLGRSFITTGGIIFAIMFLMSTLTHNAVLGRVKRELPKELAAASATNRASYGKLYRELLTRGEEIQFGRKTSVTAKRLKREANAREIWLIVLALLVAFVGIINAVLMSVTERFREIGTMKCLGALDSFIVKLFLIESSLQGFFGTSLGIGLGLAFALGKLYFDYGTTMLEFIPVSDIAARGTVALACGTFLAVVGALYPAYVAAHMEPVVAMRVDQ